MIKTHTYAPVVLRIGMALVILWFGVQQIVDVDSWVAYLPSWTAGLPVSQADLVYFNGAFEVVFGVFMLIGFYTRFVSLILALHLFHIASMVGYGAIGVRDFGLAIATTAVFMYGKDAFSIDSHLSRLEPSA